MRSNSVLVYCAAHGCSHVQTLGACIGWFMGGNNEPTVPSLLWADLFLDKHKDCFLVNLSMFFLNVNKCMYKSDFISFNLLQVVAKPIFFFGL